MKPATRERIRRVNARFKALKRAAASTGVRVKHCEIYEIIAEEEHLAPETIRQIVVNRHYSHRNTRRGQL